ncbi:MAG TPA: FecR domain-containing protein [Methylomirabilota bacterium]|nr:FecR domain-containing protein [Methylomirabilota bacterium]
MAQTEPVGVVTTLNGSASVSRASLPQGQPLKFKDDVFERDRISTAEQSLVRVLLGGKAVITIRELSVMTITEEAGRAQVNLTSGKIAVAVAKARMRPGDTLEIRTPGAVAAVRGTVLVAEVIQVGASSHGGPAGATGVFHVVSGSVEVAPRGLPSFTVGPGQSGNSQGRFWTRTAQENSAIWGGLRVNQPQLTGVPNAVVQKEQDKASLLGGLLAPRSSNQCCTPPPPPPPFRNPPPAPKKPPPIARPVGGAN